MMKMLNYIYGNKVGQNFLESLVRKCHRHLGIGTGDDVYCSGEKNVVYKMTRLKKPPYCIFDVGSHKGEYLDVVMSALGDEKFTVHCFEPSPRFFSSLSQRAAKDRRIIANNIGLGKKSDSMELYFDNEDASGTLTKRKLDHIGITRWQSEKVAITTLDEYCKKNGIDYIHLLKVDIEGHELDLFRGAEGMLKKKAVKIVTFEFGGCNIDTKTYFQDYFYFFHELQMDLYRITPSGYLYPLPSYREIDEQFRTTNFAAIDKSN